jgi:hypothetical protein
VPDNHHNLIHAPIGRNNDRNFEIVEGHGFSRPERTSIHKRLYRRGSSSEACPKRSRGHNFDHSFILVIPNRVSGEESAFLSNSRYLAPLKTTSFWKVQTP